MNTTENRLIATTGAAPVQDPSIPAQRRVPTIETGAADCTGPGGAGEAETAPIEVIPPVDATQLPDPCRCGHGLEVHEHFRAGRDCAACGCGRYRRPGLLARLRGGVSARP